MYLTTEILNDAPTTLIVGDPHAPLVQWLTETLRTKDVRTLASTHIPPDISENTISRCFCFTTLTHLALSIKKLQTVPALVCIIALRKKISSSELDHARALCTKYPHLKLAFIPQGQHAMEDLSESICAFAYSPSEPICFLEAAAPVEHPPSVPKTQASVAVIPDPWHIWILKHPKHTIIFAALSIVIVHTLFLIPLTISIALTGSHYAFALRSEKESSAPQSLDPLSYARSSLATAETLYTPIKRGWLFIGAAPLIDRTFATMHALQELDSIARTMRNDAGIVLSRIFDPQSADTDQLLRRIESLSKNSERIDDHLTTLESSIPDFIDEQYDVRKTMSKAKEYLALAQTVLAQFDEIMGKDGPKLYVLFFANNHELRPGGGFIGSFALIKTQALRVQEWKVYDVYDADGQLKARVKPPEAISKYLRQPFYFLRDSAFTPDFPTNALVAEDFLQKELGIQSIDGAMLISFSSIEMIVKALGSVRVPEYDTTITQETVYYTTQKYAEGNFFPGSTQKKDFLDALVSQLLLTFSEPKEATKMLLAIRDSFDKKYMAAYFKNPAIQSVFETYHWSGRQLPATCIETDRDVSVSSCRAVYLYPVEANLGVNKANAQVTRRYEVNTTVSTKGVIEGELITTFTNSGQKGVFPGNTYKNYYQVYLPQNTTVLTARAGARILSGYEVEKTKYTRFATWVTIPEGESLALTVRFRLPDKIPSTKSTLQVIVQKQLGVAPSDITLRFRIPENFTYTGANFSPLALQDTLEYNSTVDSDKVYYLHF